MKKTNKTADATSKLSWLQRVKVAVAALAFVAAGVFGATAVADIPEPETDETAGLQWAEPVKDYDWGRGGAMGYSRSGSWS